MQADSIMKCSPLDLIFLFRHLPYLMIMKQKAAERFLDMQIQEGIELQYMLEAYPQVHYAPLEFYYICLKGVSILDEDVISDLTQHYSWRGILIAGWLSILYPSEAFYPILHKVLPITPEPNLWIVELALAEIRQIPFKDKVLQQKFSRFRDLLHTAKYEKSSVRKLPFPDLATEEKKHTDELRSICRKEGAQAARQHMSDSPFWKLFMDPL